MCWLYFLCRLFYFLEEVRLHLPSLRNGKVFNLVAERVPSSLLLELLEFYRYEIYQQFNATLGNINFLMKSLAYSVDLTLSILGWRISDFQNKFILRESIADVSVFIVAFEVQVQEHKFLLVEELKLSSYSLCGIPVKCFNLCSFLLCHLILLLWRDSSFLFSVDYNALDFLNEWLPLAISRCATYLYSRIISHIALLLMETLLKSNLTIWQERIILTRWLPSEGVLIFWVYL